MGCTSGTNRGMGYRLNPEPGENLDVASLPVVRREHGEYIAMTHERRENTALSESEKRPLTANVQDISHYSSREDLPVDLAKGSGQSPAPVPATVQEHHRNLIPMLSSMYHIPDDHSETPIAKRDWLMYDAILTAIRATVATCKNVNDPLSNNIATLAVQGVGAYMYVVTVSSGRRYGIGSGSSMRVTLIGQRGQATAEFAQPKEEHQSMTVHLWSPIELGEVVAVTVVCNEDASSLAREHLREILRASVNAVLDENDPWNVPAHFQSIYQDFATVLDLRRAWFLTSMDVSTDSGAYNWHIPLQRWIHDSDQFKLFVDYGENAYLPKNTPPFLRPLRQLEIQSFSDLSVSFPYEGAVPCAAMLPLPIEQGFNDGKEFSFAKSVLKTSVAFTTAGLRNILHLGSFPDFESIKLIYNTSNMAVPWRGSNNVWRRDDVWGASFLVGPNAGTRYLRKLTSMPPELAHISDVLLSSNGQAHPYMEGHTLDGELEMGRLFLADFSDLKGITLSREDSTRFWGSKYCAERAMCMFRACPSTNDRPFGLLPLCIVLEPELGDAAPVFLPSDPEYEWLTAKAHVMNAAAQCHEIGTHWSYCHAAAEPVCVAVYTKLSRAHPLRRLLAPRVQYTLAINASARASLLNPAGIIEQCFALGPQSIAFTADVANIWSRLIPWDTVQPNGISFAAKSWEYWEGFLHLPKRLAKYGLDSPALEINPFSEDALLLWNAQHDWVSDYIDIYYESDAHVDADVELKAFIEAVVSGLGKAPSSIVQEYRMAANTKTSLTEFLTAFIFQVSVGHAAANFTQYEHYGFPPFMPSNMQSPPPSRKGQYVTERQFLNALPSVEQAVLVAGTVHILSQYTAGDVYELSKNQIFADPRVREAQSKYFQALEAASERIRHRNRSMADAGLLHFDYPYLDPMQLTKSVAI